MKRKCCQSNCCKKLCPRNKSYARKKKEKEALLQKNSNHSLTAGLSEGNIQLLRDADVGDLKATLKLSKSKDKIFDKMLKEFRKNASKKENAAQNGKAIKIKKKIKIKPPKAELSKLNKEKIEELLNDYIKRMKMKKALEKKRTCFLFKKNKGKTLRPILKKN